MKNIEAFIYGIYCIENCKKQKNLENFGNTEGINYMKRLYNDLSHCMVNFRFEKFDETTFLRLIDFEVDNNSQIIKYIFDINIISSEFPESNIESNNLDLAFDSFLCNITNSFRRDTIKEGRFRKHNLTSGISGILKIDVSRIYGLTSFGFEDYDNIFEFKLDDKVYVLNGKMSFINVVDSSVSDRYSQNPISRRVLKFNINLSDSTKNIDFNFDNFLKDLEMEQKKLIDNFQSKYLVDTPHTLNLFYGNLEDSEESEIVQHLKVNNEDIYNEIKDLNIDDLLAYEINVTGESNG